jgi:hypothetical protein
MKLTIKCLSIGFIAILLLFGPEIIQQARAEISAQERKALMALYDSTNGDEWTCRDGWQQTPLHSDGFAVPGSECNWYGITCNAEGTGVEQISLAGNNLKGTIPDMLGNLSYLRILQLANNQLEGSLPIRLADLSNLRELNLEYNLIEGHIPSEIANLSYLKYMLLGANLITGRIPPELGRLSLLRVLNLGSNLLEGEIPSSLGKLAYLSHLYLQDNQLSGNLPKELAELTNLKVINLRDNRLNGRIPIQFVNLTNLKDGESDLRWNHLAVLDPELSAFFKNKQMSGNLEGCQIAKIPIRMGLIDSKDVDEHRWETRKRQAELTEPM